MNTAPKIPQKIEKHVMIEDAIRDIDNVISHAENIFNKINGANKEAPEKSDTCGATEQSLLVVLNNSPQIIKEKNEQLHEILNKISEAIF